MELAPCGARCGRQQAWGAFDQERTFVKPAQAGIHNEVVIPVQAGIPVEVVIPAQAGIPVELVIPAQAGIHSCACRCSSCQDLGRPAPRHALPGSGVGCGGERLRAGPAWRSSLVASKSRTPRPQRFTGAVGAAPDCPAMLRLAAASRNSLRSLRSLRSDNRDESVDESRCARRREPWPCRPRWASGPAARQAQTVHRTVVARGSPSRRTTGALRPGRTRLCGDGVSARAIGPRTTEHHKRSVAPVTGRRGRSLGRRGAQPRGRRTQRAS